MEKKVRLGEWDDEVRWMLSWKEEKAERQQYSVYTEHRCAVN